MENELLASMRTQLCPSEAAQTALRARLERITPQRRKRPLWGGLAAAACAALALGLYSTLPLTAETKPHSYITLEAGDPAVKAEYRQVTTTQGVDKGTGDQDQAMLPEEVVEAMEEAGFSSADIDAYQALGYEMTWAKWWKYVDSGETLDLESLKSFSGQELEVNTGDLPGGAYIGDVPVQLGADAYQLLMDHFGDSRPDWFGGAYVDDSGALMVLLVEDKDPGDKTLELEVLEAVGDLPVGFTSVKYSRNDLMRMNDEIGALLDGKGIFATWGIYDDQNRIVLDVSEVLPDDILSAIAQIDPEDDAILIRVIRENAVVTPDLVKGPPPIEPIGAPAAPGGVAGPQEKRPAVVRDLPGEKDAPAEYDLLPLEEE